MATGSFGVLGITWIQLGAIKKAIAEYIRNQLQEDIAEDQMTLKEYMDPFTGEPVNKGKK